MVNFFLKLGVLNKKLIMPIITAAIYVIMNIIELNTGMENIHILFFIYIQEGLAIHVPFLFQ